MVSEECTANALEYYRLAQKAVNPDARRALLELAIRWLFAKRCWMAAHAENNRTTSWKMSAIDSRVVTGTMSVIPPAAIAAATRIMAPRLQ
jgi:hypothetical protein